MSTVSVCIPTYNCARYVGHAIQSILDQTLSDFEFIVIDNCSTDGTAAIIEAFQSSRIRYIRNETNIGMVRNWNKCIEASSGDYIIIFHADDYADPYLIENEKGILDENPHVGFVHTRAHVVDENDKPLFFHEPYVKDHMIDGVKTFKDLLLANIYLAPTVMARKECYEKVGTFDTSFAFACDST